MATITAAPSTHAAHESAADWLDVIKTVPRAPDGFRSESLVDFGWGWASLGRFKWSRPLEATWRTSKRCYFLSLKIQCPIQTDRRNVALGQTEPHCNGRVQLVAPGQTMCTIGQAGEARVLRCFIDADFVESIFSERPTSDERAQFCTVDFSGGSIEWLLSRMFRELCNAEIGLTIAVEGIARELAVEIVRALERQRTTTRHYSGGLPSWRMRLLIDRIYADGPPPTVGDLADRCGMTARHLGRAFHAETGKTLGKFIAAVTAERAAKMLKAGVPVGAVAATLGYSSSSSFAHAFHRETGLLPSDVRKGRQGLAA